MTMLKFADGFELPLRFVVQTQAILAKKRVGKSYTSDLQAEEMLEAGQHIVIIDPTGAHWGLRSSADGERPGYPIAILGGDHADVPLEPTAGAEVAEAIVADRFSAILDLSHMELGEGNRFVGDFLRRLYRLNRLPLHVFIDEADAYAPQQMQGEEMRTCGAVNTVVRRGGIKGIGVTLITQRPAVLSKSVLSQVDMLTCLRMHHPLDLEPVEKWVGKHKKGTTAAEMLESLPSLPKGEAWVWNPEDDLFRRVKLRRKRTFDSGATPEPGASVPAPRVLADIDLGKLGETIRDTMQRAQDADPKALRDEVRRLRAELEKERAAPRVTKERELEVIRKAANDAIKTLAQGVLEAFGPRVGALEVATVGEPLPSRLVTVENRRRPADIARALEAPEGTAAVRRALDELVEDTMPGVGARTLAAPKAAAARKVDDPGDLGGPELRILASLRWWREMGVDTPSNAHVALAARYQPGGSGYRNARGALHAAGMVQYPAADRIRLTELGEARAPEPDLAFTAKALHARVLDQQNGPERRLLEPLIAAYPGSLSSAELAKVSGYQDGGSGFRNARGALRSIGVIEYPETGKVRASDLLFPRQRGKR